MAKVKAKEKPRKLSRRQMVVLLGSGAMFAGAAGAENAEALPPPEAACRPVKPAQAQMTTPKGVRTVVMADPCCSEGYSVFLNGIAKANPKARKDLQAFATALNKMSTEGQMLEYCVMIWGLTAEAKEKIVQRMVEDYSLKY
jgi:hypothetical protein